VEEHVHCPHHLLLILELEEVIAAVAAEVHHDIGVAV
jgi:hypothetical protein